ncbi:MULTISPECIES: methionyl-tRNA formyltransferase [Rhodococcus]|uniref:Methionyl-tRNA formyltransferase n=1 Tax=Rhodococcus indonesiensis TaxID=3055869 RepID=A0ABT7RS17_9NOCA|nr:methionyl-tRNA formyltransferase [Rhodococcus indonesiensis]MDM7490444.1 methionyl-tRNA formyltransferase [Rhodococcus indonesiensis]
MRLVFAGTPEPAVPSLRRLLESPRHEVVAVVTRPDTTAGRGRRTVRSAVGRLADEHGIEVLTPARPRDPDFVARLTELAPDCCPVVAYGALIPQPVLDIPKFGWVNLHFSLLPAWRGAAPVQAALAAGDEVTGASTFRLEAGLDTGPVYGVVTETIRPDDTAGALLGRLADSGAALLESTLDGLEDGVLTAVPQPPDGVSHAPKVTVESARVSWDRPAHLVDRHIRSVTPAPGAWTMIGDLRVKLGPVTGTDETLAPGQILPRKDGVLVGTGSTAVRLGQVQPPGKKTMAAADWVRGARLDPEVRAQ